MLVLDAKNVSKSYGAVPALAPTSLAVSSGECVGVVGPNGIGKSTFLRILAGAESPDTGTVTRAAGASVGYVPQELHALPNESVREYLARATGLTRAEQTVERLAVELATRRAAEDEYARALDELTEMRGDTFDARCRETCDRIGLVGDPDGPIAEMSGGQVARVRLAASLLGSFDALLLDEPTNDLDYRGLSLLEEFLRDTAAGLVVVSHDRATLQATATRILAFEAETGVSALFDGDYASFERQAREKRERTAQRYRRWSEEYQRFSALRNDRRTEARAGGHQANRRSTRAAASKVRAADRELKNLERDKAEKPWQPWELQLELTCDDRPADRLVQLREVVAERGDFRLGPVDFSLSWGERVLLSGPNGAGKTTLLQMVLGEIALTGGTRSVGPRVEFSSLDQARSMFATDAALIEVFATVTGLQETEARTLLGHFSLRSDSVLRPARSLSAGERTRAVLAYLQSRRAPCLVLDEPTNHLDLEGIEQLETALDDFPGGVLLVSHDRRLTAAFKATRSFALPP